MALRDTFHEADKLRRLYRITGGEEHAATISRALIDRQNRVRLDMDKWAKHTLWASGIGCHLDSNFDSGSGTDDTALIQAALDSLSAEGGGTLYLAGVARINGAVGLILPSNVALIGVGQHAGFWRSNTTDATTGGYPVIRTNRAINGNGYPTSNIALENITINANGNFTGSATQYKNEPVAEGGSQWIMGAWLSGVDGLRIRNVTMRNSRTFAWLLQKVQNAVVEDVTCTWDAFHDLYNNDSLHLQGPITNLTVRNIRAVNGSDDVLGFTVDEWLGADANPWYALGDFDGILVDGVRAENCAQIIRLSASVSTIRNVTIRNLVADVSPVTYSSTLGVETGYFLTQFGYLANVTLDNFTLTGRCRSLWHMSGNDSVVCRNWKAEYGNANLSAETEPFVEFLGDILAVQNFAMDGLKLQRPTAHTGTSGSGLSFETVTSNTDGLVSLSVDGIYMRGFSQLVQGTTSTRAVARFQAGNRLDLGNGILFSGTLATLVAGDAIYEQARSDISAMNQRVLAASASNTNIGASTSAENLTRFLAILYRMFGKENVEFLPLRSAQNASQGTAIYSPRMDLSGDAPTWNTGGVNFASTKLSTGPSSILNASDSFCLVLVLQRPSVYNSGGNLAIHLGGNSGTQGITLKIPSTNSGILVMDNNIANGGYATVPVANGSYWWTAVNITNGSPYVCNFALSGGSFDSQVGVGYAFTNRNLVLSGFPTADADHQWGANIAAVLLIRGNITSAQNAALYAAYKALLGSGLSLP